MVHLQALKILKTPEFMPYVVFIASPPIDALVEIHKRATSEGTITKKQTVSIELIHLDLPACMMLVFNYIYRNFHFFFFS